MDDILKMEPELVLSLVNTRLRDGDGDIDHVCEILGVERGEIEHLLAGIGFRFDRLRHRFIPVTEERHPS